MSDHEESCQVAYMVPVSVEDWFSRNEMNQGTQTDSLLEWYTNLLMGGKGI